MGGGQAQAAAHLQPSKLGAPATAPHSPVRNQVAAPGSGKVVVAKKSAEARSKDGLGHARQHEV
jgi:hypothetical protein